MKVDIRDRAGGILAHLALIHDSDAPHGKRQRLAPDEEIAGHRHIRDQGIVLIDGLDPEPHRRLWRSKRDGSPLNPDLAAVGKLDPGQHLNEGRFAGPVVADEPNRFTGFKIEINAVQGVNARIPFVEAPDRYDQRGPVSPLQLDSARGSPEPRIADNREHGQRADRELEPIRIDAREDKAIVDHANQERADDGAENGADASRKRHSSNHRTRYGLQFQGFAQIGKGRLEAKDLNRSCKARGDRAHHEAGELDPRDGYPHRSRRLDEPAGRANPIAEIRLRHDRRGEQNQRHEPEKRGPEKTAADDIREQSHRDLVQRKQRGKSAGHYDGQRTHHEEHSERRNEAWNVELERDERVEKADDRADQDADGKRWPERNTGVQHERDAHRHDRENRADREIELAANHQHGEADRHRPDLRQQAEHATDVLIGEKDAVRAKFEERHQYDEEENSGEFGLLQVNLQRSFHSSLRPRGNER